MYFHAFPQKFCRQIYSVPYLPVLEVASKLGQLGLEVVGGLVPFGHGMQRVGRYVSPTSRNHGQQVLHGQHHFKRELADETTGAVMAEGPGM